MEHVVLSTGAQVETGDARQICEEIQLIRFQQLVCIAQWWVEGYRLSQLKA